MDLKSRQGAKEKNIMQKHGESLLAGDESGRRGGRPAGRSANANNLDHRLEHRSIEMEVR